MQKKKSPAKDPAATSKAFTGDLLLWCRLLWRPCGNLSPAFVYYCNQHPPFQQPWCCSEAKHTPPSWRPPRWKTTTTPEAAETPDQNPSLAPLPSPQMESWLFNHWASFGAVKATSAAQSHRGLGLLRRAGSAQPDCFPYEPLHARGKPDTPWVAVRKSLHFKPFPLETLCACEGLFKLLLMPSAQTHITQPPKPDSVKLPASQQMYN